MTAPWIRTAEILFMGGWLRTQLARDAARNEADEIAARLDAASKGA